LRHPPDIVEPVHQACVCATGLCAQRVRPDTTTELTSPPCPC
jgi:hypothetical protein